MSAGRLPVVVALGAAFLAVAVAGAVEAAPTVARVLDGEALGHRVGEWSGKPLSLADVDGDGRLDVLAQNGDRHVYAIDPRTGAVLVRVAPRYPYGPDLGPFNGARAADLDGDGVVEVVNVNRAAVVSVWSVGDAAAGPRLRWERHLDAHHGAPTADAGPVLGDLDGDGALEIVVQTEERGFYALRADGSTHWSVDHYGGNAEAVVADVDADGDLDVVAFTDGGVAYAVDGASGETLWRFDARRHGAWPGSIVSPGVVDDIDGDGRVEVVFCTRNLEGATPDYAPGAPHYRQHHLMLFALREGELLWKAKPAWARPMCAAYLLAHDADGDGRKEIFGMDWNTIGHKPGGWEQLGDAHAFAFDADGRELWHAALDPFNAKATIALADATGDGVDDVLAYDDGGLVVLDARDGRRLARLGLAGWTVKQGPVVADLDGDGDLDAVVAVEGRSHALLVVDLGSAPGAVAAAPGWSPPARAPPRAPAPTTDEEPAAGEGSAAVVSPPASPASAGGGPAPDGADDAVEGRATPAPSLLAALVLAAALVRARSKRLTRGGR